MLHSNVLDGVKEDTVCPGRGGKTWRLTFTRKWSRSGVAVAQMSLLVVSDLGMATVQVSLIAVEDSAHVGVPVGCAVGQCSETNLAAATGGLTFTRKQRNSNQWARYSGGMFFLG